MNIRRTLLFLHRWLGLLSGLIVLLVAFTGSLYAFEEEIRRLLQYDELYVSAEPVLPVSVATIIDTVTCRMPEGKIQQIRYYGNPGKAVTVFLKDKRAISIHPYNGKLLSVNRMDKDWLIICITLHRTLLLGSVGEQIIYWNTWCFIVLIVSGFVLWLPKKLRNLKSAFLIKKTTTKRRLLYDLHNVLGAYALPLLVVLAITGLIMASHGASPKYESRKPIDDAGMIEADSLIKKVYSGRPIESLRVNFPKTPKDVVTIIIRYKTSEFRKQDVFVFDQYSGEVLGSERFSNQSTFKRIIESAYEIHSGRIAGVPGKIAMFFTGLITLTLPVTGFLLWRGKKKRGSGAFGKNIKKPG